MNKKKKINLHKFYCLMELLQDNLDDFDDKEFATPRMKQLKSDLSEFCELLNNNVAGTYAIQKSTYFVDMTNKINTIVRKEFNPEM